MLPRAEHVWVTDVQVWGDRRAPGLLLGWERDRSGRWLGWVVVAHLGAQHGGPYVSQRWVPSEAIVPRATTS
ncbi:hypothetical protein [Nocardioides litoris]|uniref:hypothetical protein n=1 Tax=Nocardioides litoris TaxID=1926648 RepID=UPI0011202BF8|nr:hypothetical protein [Nocardioides litoris]